MTTPQFSAADVPSGTKRAACRAYAALPGAIDLPPGRSRLAGIGLYSRLLCHRLGLRRVPNARGEFGGGFRRTHDLSDSRARAQVPERERRPQELGAIEVAIHPAVQILANIETR